ncbi:MAG: hypothetical protein V4723_22040 [Pseudomonadota bacterium]
MQKYVPPLKHALLLALLATATGVGVFFSIRDTPSDAPVAATPATAASQPVDVVKPLAIRRTQNDAMQALMDLPELKAWTQHLETTSGGTVRGALIEYGPTPKALKGKTYWQFSFVESSPEAAQRWESFLVSERDTEILIDDDDNDRQLTLEQWRQLKKPMERKSAAM